MLRHSFLVEFILRVVFITKLRANKRACSPAKSKYLRFPRDVRNVLIVQLRDGALQAHWRACKACKTVGASHLRYLLLASPRTTNSHFHAATMVLIIARYAAWLQTIKTTRRIFASQYIQRVCCHMNIQVFLRVDSAYEYTRLSDSSRTIWISE